MSRLGAGGMGEVYLAEDPRLRRRVAIKVIEAGSASDPQHKKRLLREAQTASTLNHPNIGIVYDAGETEDGVSYIALEFIEGETLADVLARGPLPLPAAIDAAIQIAEALEEAHRHGIVHRDLKPSNVMLTRTGRPKVVDFGLATIASADTLASIDASTQLLTQAGGIVGTVPYMSPEQAKGEPVDSRSDIFSFGSMLYEMLTARRAFPGHDLVSTIHAITQREPEPLSTSGERDIAAVESVVRRCLEKDKNRRYQSAADVAADLRRVKGGSPLEGHRASRLPLRPLAAAAAVVGLIGIIALVAASRGSDEPGAGAATEASLPAADSQVPRAVAVLPFVSTTSDPETEQFSDGMTEEIINALANTQGLRVASRSSVFALKGQAVDVRALGKTLHVDAVVEGSVRKAGNRIRVVAQLAKTTDGYQLWSHTFERELTDVFAIQQEIARAIAARLSGGGGDGMADVKAAPTQNLEAYRFFLAGRSLARQNAIAPLRAAVRNFERAVQLDPAFALAYAEMAEAYKLLVDRAGLQPEEGFRKAEEAARQAIAIDSTTTAAHATLAGIHAHQQRWSEAEAAIRTVISLSPNAPDGYRSYSSLLVSLGRAEEAVAQARKAHELNPANAATLGRALYHARSFDEALRWFEQALQTNPQSAVLRFFRAMSLAQLRRFPEAEAEMQRAIEYAGDQRWRTHLAHIHALRGARREAEQLVEDVMKETPQDTRPRVEWATVYAVLGDTERALHWLEDAYRERPSDLVDVKAEPDLASLHGHPRFEALLKRLGLPPSRPASGP